jgi:outer membrane receptor protein involved in Fe transport
VCLVKPAASAEAPATLFDDQAGDTSAETSARGGTSVKLFDRGDHGELSEIVVEAKKPLSAASSDEIRARDFDLRPHSTIIEILNNVPGLVVAQHQGGAKAPQYLIRGFDSDHGTDLALFVDGTPVNLVSHAHGQGYADLNFVIPETIERLRLFKGPYFVQFGDFMNAGALDLVTKDRVAENSFLAEGGSWDTQRYLAQASQDLGNGTLYLAAQARYGNGPFENPQNLAGYNWFGKYTVAPTPDSTLRVSTFLYDADWDGSGQIPLRAVTGYYPNGQPFLGPRISRFGSIDPTEGGKTDKEQLNLDYELRPSPIDDVKIIAYGFRYRLALWSDFTFNRFTGDRFIRPSKDEIIDTGDAPVIPDANYIPSDQIEQDDMRWTFGVKARWEHSNDLLGIAAQTRLGLENRNDDVDLALHRDVRRSRFFTVNQLRIEENSVSAYVEEQLFPTDWMRVELGLRGDVYFMYGRNRLPDQLPDPNFDANLIQGSNVQGLPSPKANVVLNVLPQTELYLNFGMGLHSNDARVALPQGTVTPGQPVVLRAASNDPLTRSIGTEIGSRTSVLPGLDAAASLWYLHLDSELVFSGDSGTVDAQIDDTTGNFVPGPPSERYGVDLELRYQINDWLWSDYDLNWAHARFDNGGFVPLAPTLLMNGGLTARFENGFSAGLRGRFLADRPADETGSLTATGWFLMDLLAAYRWQNVQVSLALQNLTNTQWREAQFADDTCLTSELGNVPGCVQKPGKNAPDGVHDIHFTPGNPFTVLAGVQLYF